MSSVPPDSDPDTADPGVTIKNETEKPEVTAKIRNELSKVTRNMMAEKRGTARRMNTLRTHLRDLMLAVMRGRVTSPINDDVAILSMNDVQTIDQSIRAHQVEFEQLVDRMKVMEDELMWNFVLLRTLKKDYLASLAERSIMEDDAPEPRLLPDPNPEECFFDPATPGVAIGSPLSGAAAAFMGARR